MHYRARSLVVGAVALLWQLPAAGPGFGQGLVCGEGLYFDEQYQRCRRTNPIPGPSEPSFLKNPPDEKDNPENRPQKQHKMTIVDPLTGVPREVLQKDVEAILERRRDELLALPGVVGSGIDKDGIVIWTWNPLDAPKESEGIPVRTEQPFDAIQLSHTASVASAPYFGTTAITSWSGSTLNGSSTVPVLARGLPWVTPSTACFSPSFEEEKCAGLQLWRLFSG